MYLICVFIKFISCEVLYLNYALTYLTNNFFNNPLLSNNLETEIRISSIFLKMTFYQVTYLCVNRVIKFNVQPKFLRLCLEQ